MNANSRGKPTRARRFWPEASYFHLDDADRELLTTALGMALQIVTARFSWTFLADPTDAAAC